jgi:PAS domain S-box-containing protein
MQPGDSWPEPAWDVLEIITSASADGITVQDATGKLIYANDSAARMSGFSSGKVMQQASPDEIVERFELLDEEGLPMPVGELPGRRALGGERQPEAVVRFRRRLGGYDRWALVRATPIFDPRGQVRHVVNVFVDITADRERRQAQSFLADATKELVRSLNWEATIQRVARLAVPVMADWCTVDVLERDGSLSLIAVAHVDPEKVQWARELRRRFPPEASDTSGIAHVARTGESELIPEVTRELIDAANITDPELLDVIQRLQLSSVMTIPLIAHGRTVGVLTMVWAESGRHYSQEDLRLGEDLASRAALAIDNARLYRERDHAARSLQERLLPKRLPRIPEIDVAARYLPAGDALQAGGDFYDLFEMDDGSWKAVIGDVCGKGPEAAALMGFVRFTMRAVSRQDTKPSEALVKLNRSLLEELEIGRGEFCTAAVVRMRPNGKGIRLTIAVAGHPLPLVLRANGAVEEVGIPGTLLGMFEEIDISDQIVDLDAGDVLVMLTDGVLEAGRDEGWEREVLRLLADSVGMSPDAIADRIRAAVSDLDDRRTDDVALMVLQARN